MPPATPAANFNRIARLYRWLEYLSFGPALERCRFYRIPELASAKRALVLGDGDGRFLARLLAANPTLHADVVDQSSAMLHLIDVRISANGARDRIQIDQADARVYTPGATYDLVVTHFFLDCFSTEEVQTIAANIRPSLAPNARWLISDFRIPGGIAALPAKFIVAALYAAFQLLTGLQTRSLPDYTSVFIRAGLVLRDRASLLAGLLVSELWGLEDRSAGER